MQFRRRLAPAWCRQAYDTRRLTFDGEEFYEQMTSFQKERVKKNEKSLHHFYTAGDLPITALLKFWPKHSKRLLYFFGFERHGLLDQPFS